jgi:DNA repair exonuclease SbcCD nuclease subunit
MVRFLHTADLQLGMPYQWAGPRGDDLRRRRAECISRIAEVADEHDVDFVVIAGDFFDANTVDDRVVVRACEHLGKFEVPLFILPGNHDAGGGPNSVYKRDKFRRNKPALVSILTDPEPVLVADGKAVILPAPLHYRHSRSDPTAHLTPEFGRKEAPEAIRIGLAHGGITDFGDSMNVIAPDRATIADLDYLALGDWHSRKEIDRRTWYSGAPEPTGFNEVDSGKVLIVEIEDRGDIPQVTTVEVGSTIWEKKSITFDDSPDLEALAKWFDDLENPLNTLVRLEYGGVLSLEDERRLEDEILSDADDRLLYLRRRPKGLSTRASDEELEQLKGQGFVGVAVEELQQMMSADDEEAADKAARALQLLYRIQSTQR